jgi:mRNA-degrading endonuclease RelE of RelBE toxin-antitoxin system
MVIIETPIFTRQVQTLLSDEQYHMMQHELIVQPDAGDIIRGSGGLRKFRWSKAGKGKRGGVRVIYYWHSHLELILMLLIYPKSKQDDLTRQQLKILKELIEKEFK